MEIKEIQNIYIECSTRPQEMTFEEIGKIFGVARQCIHQAEEKCMKILIRKTQNDISIIKES